MSFNRIGYESSARVPYPGNKEAMTFLNILNTILIFDKSKLELIIL